MNVWQLIIETHFKSEKVNFQHCSSISGAKICGGKELRDAHLTFQRRDSWYLLWFELELQKHQFPPLPAPLTSHATSLLFNILTIPPLKMLHPSVSTFSPRRRHCRSAGTMLAGNSPLKSTLIYPLCGFFRQGVKCDVTIIKSGRVPWVVVLYSQYFYTSLTSNNN